MDGRPGPGRAELQELGRNDEGPCCGTFRSPRGRDLNVRKLSAIIRNRVMGEPLRCLGTGLRPCTECHPWPRCVCLAAHRPCTYVPETPCPLCVRNLPARPTCKRPCDRSPKSCPCQHSPAGSRAAGGSRWWPSTEGAATWPPVEGGRPQGPQISKGEATDSIALVSVTWRKSHGVTVSGAGWRED